MELRAAVLAGILFFVASNVYGEPVLEASEDGVRVVLHTDKCALKEVSNAPYRAVWHENGKTVEGCYFVRPDYGVVILYFAADRTLGIAPIRAFRRVTSI
jgi:hypothetical protein